MSTKIKETPGMNDPRLTEAEAKVKFVAEFAEGANARKEGKAITQNPYAIFNLGYMISGADYRDKFEYKFDAWMYGFNSLDA